jgi:hypothetical protein
VVALGGAVLTVEIDAVAVEQRLRSGGVACPGYDMLYGIGAGNEWGIDHELGSRYLIAEWDYPDIGVVAFGTPSGGHDTVMLDYTNLGPDGEPTVAYVDEDRVPRTIAGSFAEFLAVLRPESDYSDD